MHLRPPSVDHGVQAGLWAVGLGLLIFFGMVAVGVSDALSFVIAVVAAVGIFVFVRTCGEDSPGER
jgi:hypothetical protein